MRKRRGDEGIREREREQLNREARLTFGRSGHVLDIPDGVDPRVARQEEERMAARHDPTKASSCRLCGQIVAPTEGTVGNWKCCARCSTLLPQGLAGVWGDLLDEQIAKAEMDELIERGIGNPARFVTGWATEPGRPGRWEHVEDVAIDSARSALGEIRREARLAAAPRANVHRLGCCWCGIATSTRWVESPWRAGGRGGPKWPSCATCAPWIARSGGVDEAGGSTWRNSLFAVCVGLPRARTGTNYDLVAFMESDPADPSGTEESWQYLSDLRAQLRALVIRRFPRSVTLTPNEARVLAAEAALAATEPPVARPLANLQTISKALRE